MSNQRGTLVPAIIVLLLLISGCGNGQGEMSSVSEVGTRPSDATAASGPGGAGTGAPAVAEDETEGTEDSTGSEITLDRPLRVFLGTAPYEEGLLTLLGEFEADTGIDVEMEIVGQEVFEQRTTLAFTGGTNEFDVVGVPAIQLQRWVQAGWIQPMTDLVETNDTELELDDFLDAALGSYALDGEHWGLPVFAEAGIMAYRTDVLEAANVDPPETWEELLEVAEKIHDEDTAAVALRSRAGQGLNMFILPMLMRAYGGEFFVDYPDDLTPALNSPENVAALEIYAELVSNYSPPGGTNFSFPEVVSAVQQGQAAIAIDGTAIVSQVVDPEASPVADQIGLARVPGGPEGVSPAVAVHGLGIPATTDAREAAFEFIAWASSSEVQRQIALEASYPDFTRQSVAEDAEVQQKYAEIHPDLLDLRVEALELARPDYRPLLPQWPDIGTVVGELVNGVVNGQMTPEEALKAADAEVAEILR